MISTNASSAANAIDPAIFRDASNNLWLAYGSYFGGIRIMQLDAATGKPTGATQYAVANGGVEAAYVKQRGAFYYLFINRGTCCQGTSSTYYIQVGRSASPTRPFPRQERRGPEQQRRHGAARAARAATVGPGHTGIFEENGTAYFSHHYYDRYDSGAPKLGLAKLTWDAADWPVVSRDWVAPRPLRNSCATPWPRAGAGGLVWQARAARRGGPGHYAGHPHGQHLPAVGLHGAGRRRLQNHECRWAAWPRAWPTAPTPTAPCCSWAPTPARTASSFASTGPTTAAWCLPSSNSNRVVEVPFASTAPGVQLGLFDYNGCACQRWYSDAGRRAAGHGGPQALTGVSIYPVPASARQLHAGPERPQSRRVPLTVEVLNLQGSVVFRQRVADPQATVAVEAGLLPGLLLVQVRQGTPGCSRKN